MKKVFVVVALGILTCISRGPALAWQVWSGNGHEYQAVLAPGGIDFFTAKASAEAMGGYLATIHSNAENSFVYSLIADPAYWWFHYGAADGPWLGGYQAVRIEPDGGWAWVTGEPWTYTNWGGGQPDNNRGDEHYLHFWGNASVWNDHGYTAPLSGYVVERGALVPEPSALLALAGGLGCLASVFWRHRR